MKTKRNNTQVTVLSCDMRPAMRVAILLALMMCLTKISFAQLGVAYIQELQPPSSPAGASSDLSLTITGVNIDTTAVVKFDGTTLSGTCSGFNQCKVTVPKSLLATAHTAIVTVANPTFSVSNAAFFPVTASAPQGFSNNAAIVGTAPQAIGVADLNGDGKQDLVVVNSSDNNFSVLLGNGDGTFKKPDGTACGASGSPCPTFSTGHNPRAVVVGDFDNDGKIDVVVANKDDNTLSLFKGDGNGGFGAASTINIAGVAPVGLVAVDLDFDGKLDLFVINQTDHSCSGATGTGSLSVLFGDGTGKFSNKSNAGPVAISDVCLNVTPVAIATGDIDNNAEHFPDFAITSGSVPSSTTCAPGDGTVTVVDGTSIFNATQSMLNSIHFGAFCAGQNPGGITAADFNNDGILDLAVTNTGGNFAVLINKGTGTFGVPNSQNSYVTYPAGTNSPIAIIAGDIDGDGKVDVAMADQGSNAVAVANGNGDGTFHNPFGGSISSTANTNGGTGPVGLVAADFNGDGRLDIATANHNDNPGTVTIMLQAPQLTVLCISSQSDGCTGPPQPGQTGTPALLFGNVVIGSSSAPLKIKVENDGSAPITFNPINDANNFQPPTSDFSQTNTCGTSLAISANCEIDVTFNPHASGDLSSALKIPGLNNSFQFVSVSGTGVEAAVTFNPQTIAFGQQLINAPAVGAVAPPQLSGTLTNTGNSDLKISGTVTSSTSEFAIVTENCSNTTKKPNESCSFTVSFSPTLFGLRKGTLVFPTNIGSISLNLFGQGTTPTVSLTNPPLLFSNQQVGTTSAPQTILLSNIGNGQLFFADNVPAFALSGANPDDFAITGNSCPLFPLFLDVSLNCSITVTFTPNMKLPTPITARSATLVITDNDAGSMSGGHPSATQTAILNGTATAPVVSYNVPLSPTVGLDFGGVPVTTTSAPLGFQISNVGTAPLSITSIVSTNPDYLIVGNTCPLLPATLAVNTNCNVTVRLTPSAVGTRTGSIVVTDNDRGTPTFITTQTVVLNGAGTDFSLSASPTAITISPSKTATYTVTLNPNPPGTTLPFTNPVTYSCAIGPPHSNCFVSGVSNGSATVILSTSQGVNHGTFTLTFTATFTPAAPAGGPPGASALAHSTTATITVK